MEVAAVLTGTRKGLPEGNSRAEQRKRGRGLVDKGVRQAESPRQSHQVITQADAMECHALRMIPCNPHNTPLIPGAWGTAGAQ